MRNIFIAFFTFISCLGYADEIDDVEDFISYHPYNTQSSSNRLSQGYIIDKSQVMPGYNAQLDLILAKTLKLSPLFHIYIFSLIKKDLHLLILQTMLLLIKAKLLRCTQIINQPLKLL